MRQYWGTAIPGRATRQTVLGAEAVADAVHIFSGCSTLSDELAAFGLHCYSYDQCNIDWKQATVSMVQDSYLSVLLEVWLL